jgi:hypothetical protein
VIECDLEVSCGSLCTELEKIDKHK